MTGHIAQPARKYDNKELSHSLPIDFVPLLILFCFTARFTNPNVILIGALRQ
jgi:hypothetical protein